MNYLIRPPTARSRVTLQQDRYALPSFLVGDGYGSTRDTLITTRKTFTVAKTYLFVNVTMAPFTLGAFIPIPKSRNAPVRHYGTTRHRSLIKMNPRLNYAIVVMLLQTTLQKIVIKS